MARESRIARFRSTYRRATDALDNLSWLPNLLLRVSVGFMFFSGAVGKLADLGKFTAMFAGLGIPAAQTIAPMTVLAELVGGAALMLGIGTRPVSLVLGGDMVGALITEIGPDLARKYPSPWYFLSNLFYASEWLLVGLLAWLVCVGAGRASVDAVISRRSAALTSRAAGR
jgi:putative oxidoreductase